jgi:hypothetical protein
VNAELESAANLVEQTRAEAEGVVATFLAIPEPLRRRSKDRWSAAENLDHLRLSVRPLNLALVIPRFALRVFGKPRAQRGYEHIADDYRRSLAAGAKATPPFIPAPLSPTADSDRLVRGFRDAHATYAERLSLLDYALLDSIRLPHPILGRLSLREMACFTLYHLRHHHEAIRREGQPA